MEGVPARNAQWSIGHQREDYGSIVVYKEARVSGADVGCFFGKYVTVLYVVRACGCSIADGKRGGATCTNIAASLITSTFEHRSI